MYAARAGYSTVRRLQELSHVRSLPQYRTCALSGLHSRKGKALSRLTLTPSLQAAPGGGVLAFDTDVHTGSSLDVSLGTAPADVRVAAGPLSSAHVEARWASGSSAGAPPVSIALEGGSIVAVRRRPAEAGGGGGFSAVQGLSIDAKTPPRFFSVSVETGG